MRALLAIALFSLAPIANAAHLHVRGTVTDAVTREPLKDVLVRVYKNGVKECASNCGANGRYDVLLDNNANYVIRFSLGGCVTKCFAVDTHGPAWEGDGAVSEVEVEMTMFERVDGLDLSFFDMPMGMATFTPMTGYLTWDANYEAFVRPETERLFAEAMARKEQSLAQAHTSRP